MAEGDADAENCTMRLRMLGYPDKAIERISGQKIPQHEHAVFKMVDTCAAEFAAQTPYFYSTYDEENEAEEFIEAQERYQADDHRIRIRTDSNRSGYRVRLCFGTLRMVSEEGWISGGDRE